MILKKEMDKKTQCDICDQTFSHKADFKTHVQTIHGSIERFKCDNCPKSYTRQEHLKFHKKVTHTEKKSIKCDFVN